MQIVVRMVHIDSQFVLSPFGPFGLAYRLAYFGLWLLEIFVY